ncbi:hypothetical protein ACFL34_03915 [Candidatus Sumerlaeota bacterium]
MKRKHFIAIAILPAACLLGLWFMYVSILGSPMSGEGQYLESPDDKYEAHAMTMTYLDIWANTKRYYDFYVTPKGGVDGRDYIKFVRMEHLPGRPPFPMRGGDKIITWAEDSKSVSFAFQGIELKMWLEQATEADQDAQL